MPHVSCGIPVFVEAVVVTDPQASGAELDAFVTGEESLDVDELRCPPARFARLHAAAHSARLAELPLTPNGKLDRRALPIGRRSDLGSGRTHEPPATDTERALVAIWEEVLGQPRIGVTDNFFEAGGHSLRVARVMGLVEQRLGIAAPLTTLFRSPTVRELAAALLDGARFGIAAIDDPMVRLGVSATGRLLFAFLPEYGDAAGFFQLAQKLDDCTFYAFNFIEADERLQRYADLMASVDPNGPCVLLGYSSGGNLAYHVAGCSSGEDRGQRHCHDRFGTQVGANTLLGR